MANSVDPDQTAPQGGSGSTLFACAILSETFVFYFRTFTIIRKYLGLPKAGLNFE